MDPNKPNPQYAYHYGSLEAHLKILARASASGAPVSEEAREWALNAVPPESMEHGFISGEPYCHTIAGEPVFACFRRFKGVPHLIYATRRERWLNPLQMQRFKRAGKIITMGLPGGKQIRLSIYLSSWKKLLTLDPHTDIPNWNWYPVSAGRILYEISRGVHDRINQKLPWYSILYRYNPDSEPHARRIRFKLDQLVARGLLKCECRWCGRPLNRYVSNRHNRFCDASCRRSYY